MDTKIKITEIRHPSYTAASSDWRKWRLTALGGDVFIEEYVKRFSLRENINDFVTRKALTPCPAFAKGALIDVKNAIFQRTTDITRVGGSKSYQAAVIGREGGVDLTGQSMNSFIGTEVLPELLTMAKVGVYVDMPQVAPGSTLQDTQSKRPYIYVYQAEDILSWAFAQNDEVIEFKSVLLREHYTSFDAESGLATDDLVRYRHAYVEDGHVNIKFYDADGVQIDASGAPSTAAVILDIPHIPLVICEISDSLLSDIANHQIALVNLESSDVAYALKCNFPFYTEQFDPRANSPFLKGPAQPISEDDSSDVIANTKEPATSIGGSTGRKYPLGTERPGFIHPSSEPLTASMAKQKQLKEDIRQLVALALSNLNPKMASAESKALDMQGLEAGLSYIGLELENCERRIAEYWSIYEGGDVATVKYPERYSLRSDSDKRAEAKELEERIEASSSITYKRELAKQSATLLVGGNVSIATLNKIYKEIDSADVICASSKTLDLDIKNGLVSKETASAARCYPAGDVDIATEEQAEKLKMIQASQAPVGGDPAARGLPDASMNPNASSDEKEGKMKRGKADE